MSTRVQTTLLSVVLALVLLMLTASPSNAQSVTHRGLSVTLEVTKSLYLVGEPVRIRVILRNETDTPSIVHFVFGERYALAISGQRADQSIGIVDGAAWRLSGRGSQSVVVDPRQAVVFDETWDQRTERGVVTPPGRYLIRGMFRGLVEFTSRDELLTRRQLGLAEMPALGRQVGVIHGRSRIARVTLTPVHFTIRN
ncbi:MAG: hypothetical protein ACRDF1_01890 [bacterium]